MERKDDDDKKGFTRNDVHLVRVLVASHNKIGNHRIEIRRLEAEIAMAQRNAGDHAYMERLKHHQKTHQWLVYAIQTERMFQAHYRLAPRRQNT